VERSPTEARASPRAAMTIVVIAGVGLVGSCLAIARLPNLVESPGRFLALFALAFVCYTAGIASLPSGNATRPLAFVLVVGAAARLALFPAPPTLSTDAYRYVWDARVAHAGISPYAYPPWATELERLRDTEVFPRLNHPTWRTIYPPGAQAFFQLVYRIRPDSVRAVKLAVGLVELVGVLAVCGLLRAGRRPLSHAIVYVWNPLVLVEVWATAHVDAILVPAVAGAAWMALRGRHVTAGALLGAGALIKLYPAALLLLLPLAALPAALLGFSAVVVAGYAPAVLSGTAVLGSLPRYLSEEYFNVGVVRSLVPSPLLSVAAAAAWVVIVSVIRREVALSRRAVTLVGGLLVLSPNIFPWYAIWLVPFLAWSRSVPWIAFTGTVMFAYAFFLQDPWAIPGWARTLEFAPLAIGILWWCATKVSAQWWQERSA
jgi:hypothetical protein